MNPSVIELPAPELKTALTGLGKVISKRTTLPVLEHLRVTRDRAGVVTLQATDLDTTVSYQAEALAAGSPCDFLVPFAPLNQAVKGGKESVQLIVESKDRVRLRTFIGASPIEQALASLPVDEFPPTPVITGKAVPLDATFRDTLRQALDCCSESEGRHVMEHVCLDTRLTDGHYLVASDGRHLFCANSFQFDLKQPVLIPARAFLRWTKFMEDGAAELSVKPATKQDGSWLQLKSGCWTLITKSCDESFPEWQARLPLPDRNRTRIELNTSAVATLLAGVPRLPGHDDQNRPVRLDVAGSTLIAQARAKDADDWTQFTVNGATILGPAVSIRLNRDYLLKALRFGLTTVEIADAMTPLEFSDGGRRMFVSPLRPLEPPPTKQPAVPKPAADTSPQPKPPAGEPAPAQPQKEQPMPKPTETPAEEPTPPEPSPVRAAVAQIENLRETVKGVLREFNGVLDRLKQLEKEQKATDKEVESVRQKLHELRSVRI